MIKLPTLKEQVCSLELSRALDELGIKSAGLFCWAQWQDQIFVCRQEEEAAPGERFIVQAYTVAELGIIMDSKWKTFKTAPDKWFYKKTGEENMFGPFPTEADARAVAIIKRLESINAYRAASLPKE